MVVVRSKLIRLCFIDSAQELFRLHLIPAVVDFIFVEFPKEDEPNFGITDKRDAIESEQLCGKLRRC